MTHPEYGPAIVGLARNLDILQDRASAFEALQTEHDAIQQLLQSLWEAIISGAGRAEVIGILNNSVDFCTTHFAAEERFMRESGCDRLDEHVAAHQQLLGEILSVRRRASGEGLSLAVLDAADLLQDFQQHVRTLDQAAYGSRCPAL